MRARTCSTAPGAAQVVDVQRTGTTPGGAVARRLAPTTMRPDRASSAAAAAPMPDEAPVTSTTGRREIDAWGIALYREAGTRIRLGHGPGRGVGRRRRLRVRRSVADGRVGAQPRGARPSPAPTRPMRTVQPPRRCPTSPTTTWSAPPTASAATRSTSTSAATPASPWPAAELARRGVRLLLDFVPNHVAPDHPWVTEHPEYLVTGHAGRPGGRSGVVRPRGGDGRGAGPRPVLPGVARRGPARRLRARPARRGGRHRGGHRASGATAFAATWRCWR